MVKTDFAAQSLVVWCSWLSRQSNTLKVSSSRLDIAKRYVLQMCFCSQLHLCCSLEGVQVDLNVTSVQKQAQSPIMSLMNMFHSCSSDSVMLPEARKFKQHHSF